MQHGPAVRRRKLGAELRALRAGAGLTSGEAARLAGLAPVEGEPDRDRRQRGETGRRDALLLDAYGVADRESARAAASCWRARRGRRPAPLVARLPRGAAARRTGTSSAWSRRPARCAPWRPRWCRGCCRPPEYARAVTRAAVDGLDETQARRPGRGAAGPAGRAACGPAAGAERRARRGGAAAGGRRPRGDGASAAAAAWRRPGCLKCGCRYCRSPPGRTSASPGLSLSSHFRTLLIWMWLFSTT